MIRVFGSPELHRFGRVVYVTRSRQVEAETRCGTRFVYGLWPKGHPRPRIPRCAACFAS